MTEDLHDVTDDERARVTAPDGPLALARAAIAAAHGAGLGTGSEAARTDRALTRARFMAARRPAPEEHQPEKDGTE